MAHRLPAGCRRGQHPKWWEQFDDPVLTGLVESALRDNRDLVIAAARVDAFLGQLQTTRSQFYPQANYDLNASRNRVTKVGSSPLPPGADPYYTLYQGALGASWQLDLFGRVRRQTEAAQARVYATEQGRRGVVLSVVTSMALQLHRAACARPAARNFAADRAELRQHAAHLRVAA